MSKDEYYANTAARLDTIIGGNTDHFLRLQRVRNEWQELEILAPLDVPPFNTYVEEQYGIRLSMVDRNLSLNYTVVDAVLYTAFLLKFSR